MSFDAQDPSQQLTVRWALCLQAIDGYVSGAMQKVQTAAAAERKSQDSRPRDVVFGTDLGGTCKEGQLAPGQSWDVECGPSLAPFKASANMGSQVDDTSPLAIAGGGTSVTCGCSDLQIDVRRRLGDALGDNEQITDTDAGIDSSDKPAPSFREAQTPAPAPRFFSNKPSPVVPHDIKCHFQLKVCCVCCCCCFCADELWFPRQAITSTILNGRKEGRKRCPH